MVSISHRLSLLNCFKLTLDCFLNMIFVPAETISFDILFVNVLNQLILPLDFQNNFQHDR